MKQYTLFFFLSIFLTGCFSCALKFRVMLLPDLAWHQSSTQDTSTLHEQQSPLWHASGWASWRWWLNSTSSVLFKRWRLRSMPANSQVCSAAVRREYRAVSSPACITPTYLFVLAVGPDNGVTVPSHIERWDQQEEYDSSMASDRTLQTTSEFSSGQKISERLSSSGTSSGRSSLWRERLLLTEAGASPESSISGG